MKNRRKGDIEKGEKNPSKKGDKKGKRKMEPVIQESIPHYTTPKAEPNTALQVVKYPKAESHTTENISNIPSTGLMFELEHSGKLGTITDNTNIPINFGPHREKLLQ